MCVLGVGPWSTAYCRPIGHCAAVPLVYYILVGVGYKLYESQFYPHITALFLSEHPPERIRVPTGRPRSQVGTFAKTQIELVETRVLSSRATVERARRKLQAPRLYQPYVHDDPR